MAKFKLTQKHIDRLSETVKKAESKTTGEIATAFIKESDEYSLWELYFSLICGFVYFIIMMFFVSPIESWLSTMFWNYDVSYIVLFYGFSTFLVIGIVYFIASITLIERLIVPNRVLKEKVENRAMRHFIEAGVHNTKDSTGILIFISYLEKRVLLLADSGISAKIPQKKWQEIVQHIIDGIHAGKMVDHLAEAIEECGVLLAEHFPIKPGTVNELDNEIAILET
jgi:putative membrane protein